MVSRAAHAKILELSKPPGPASLWYAVGAVFRQVGRAVDESGRALQMHMAYDEKLPVPCTAVKVAGKAPTIGQSFVAPSATLTGAVDLKAGASVWYGAVIRAQGAPISIGEMSSVQENATLTASGSAPVSVGKLVTIGAGSIIDSASVGDEAHIGCGCIVSAGAAIGKGAVLTAGSVLPAKTTVPANEIWSGKPAKKVGGVPPAEKEALLAEARSFAALAAIHQEHAWMDLEEIEFQAAQYKIEAQRPENWSQQLRDAPTFEELPKLKKRIAEVTAKIN